MYVLLLSVVVLVERQATYCPSSICGPEWIYVQATELWKVLVKKDVSCPDSDERNLFNLLITCHTPDTL